MILGSNAFWRRALNDCYGRVTDRLPSSAAEKQLDPARGVSGVVGTSISTFFLIVVALVNLVILRGVWQSFQEARRTGRYTDRSPGPVRKLYYNLTITFVSVVAALLVGGIEAIGLVKDQLNLQVSGGGRWSVDGGTATGRG
jgi:high-affinity nickel permease